MNIITLKYKLSNKIYMSSSLPPLNLHYRLTCNVINNQNIIINNTQIDYIEYNLKLIRKDIEIEHIIKNNNLFIIDNILGYNTKINNIKKIKTIEFYNQILKEYYINRDVLLTFNTYNHNYDYLRFSMLDISSACILDWFPVDLCNYEKVYMEAL